MFFNMDEWVVSSSTTIPSQSMPLIHLTKTNLETICSPHVAFLSGLEIDIRCKDRAFIDDTYSNLFSIYSNWVTLDYIEATLSLNK